MLRAEVGYTLAMDWQPNLAVQYDWASGDESPDDNRFDQYERLFGGRRTDLNNTSLHGPLTPPNLNAPGARLEVRPSDRLDARLTYSAAFLASDTDRWVIAGLRDETGSSGSFVGHVFDGSARIRLLPGRLHGEFGASFTLFYPFGLSSTIWRGRTSAINVAAGGGHRPAG